jgi:hypothetical protein
MINAILKRDSCTITTIIIPSKFVELASDNFRIAIDRDMVGEQGHYLFKIARFRAEDFSETNIHPAHPNTYQSVLPNLFRHR